MSDVTQELQEIHVKSGQPIRFVWDEPLAETRISFRLAESGSMELDLISVLTQVVRYFEAGRFDGNEIEDGGLERVADWFHAKYGSIKREATA